MANSGTTPDVVLSTLPGVYMSLSGPIWQRVGVTTIRKLHPPRPDLEPKKQTCRCDSIPTWSLRLAIEHVLIF